MPVYRNTRGLLNTGWTADRYRTNASILLILDAVIEIYGHVRANLTANSRAAVPGRKIIGNPARRCQGGTQCVTGIYHPGPESSELVSHRPAKRVTRGAQ